MLVVIAANRGAGEIRARAVDAVRASLLALGHDVAVLEADAAFTTKAAALSADLVFNMCSGNRSGADQARFAAVLELAGLRFTGPGSSAHMLGLDKFLTKLVAQAAGIPTPGSALIGIDEATLAGDLENLRFPAIVKPAREGSSAGIGAWSLVGGRADLAEAVRRCTAEYDQPALVEEFVVGREFTVAILERDEVQVLPPEEIVFGQGEDPDPAEGWGFYSKDVKDRDAVRTVCPAMAGEPLLHDLRDLALRAYRVVGCRDYGRVDFRVPLSGGAPMMLEVNTLPGLTPRYSELPRIAEAAGVGFQDLVSGIVESALKRRKRP